MMDKNQGWKGQFDIDKYISILCLSNCPDLWDLKKYL